VLDIVYPVHSPSQPLDNTIGAIALHLIFFVVVTSYLRVRVGRRLWKLFHFTIYLAIETMFWHSLFTDPGLKNAAMDWFDGGKVFIEVCVSVAVTVGLLRSRYYYRKKAVQAGEIPVRAAASQ
jgi:DMSO/TMAO reductase YedYZ heme-binding membrane subunit